MQPEIAGDNLTCLLEVLRDLVIDHRQLERAGARVRQPLDRSTIEDAAAFLTRGDIAASSPASPKPARTVRRVYPMPSPPAIQKILYRDVPSS